MKSALLTLAVLLGVALGTATLAPASANVSLPYSENSGGGSG